MDADRRWRAVNQLDSYQRDTFRRSTVPENQIGNEMKKPSILIVDDQPLNLVLVEKILSELELNVVKATSGSEAIELVQDNDFAMIILDVHMPELDGFETAKIIRSREDSKSAVPIVFLTAQKKENKYISKGYEVGAVDYLLKPIDQKILRSKVSFFVEQYRQKQTLAQQAESAMKNLQTTQIVPGVYWVQVPEAGLYILCGCPADIVKQLMRKEYITAAEKDGISFETGPNVILLSEVPIQNGEFSNLAEFPVLQMLYRQGMILPNHPNNTGVKPLLVGAEEQVKAQMAYIYRGNYGLTTRQEIQAAGISSDMADEMMRMKMKFAFGEIRPTEDFLESRTIGDASVEIRDGVYAKRLGFNRYEFQYKGKSTVIDLNLKPNETYESPYKLGFHKIDREYFAVIHSGEGDGWDIHRPCMASILMFDGEIYLVDAGPNTICALKALGIDISEIRGIFHTHAHDDHFAGLPTLMKSDHRIKYYATPLVRSSVSKKLSALMSMEEKNFSQYFEVHDLAFDTWNDLDGLEVKPIFSPHPLETNVFQFRVLGKDGYVSYAHWADIVSLEVFEKMVADDSSREGVSRTFFDTVKANYLLPVDLKKIDIAAGLIHGQAADFVNDASAKIILSHTSTPLTQQQKEIGSETSFGALDILIPNYQNYLRRQAFRYLNAFFPTISQKKLQVLLNLPIVSFNPGSIIQEKGRIAGTIYLILAGGVEFIKPESETSNVLSNGCFVGDVSVLRDTPLSGTCRAVSHVQAIRFPAPLYRTFLEKNGLYEQVKSIIDNIQFLQETWLFGEGTSFPIQNKIARVMSSRHHAEGNVDLKEEKPGICLLKSGSVGIVNAMDEEIESLKSGDFFGEDRLFPEMDCRFQFDVTQPSELVFIEDYPIMEIPIVHWKLLEILKKRSRSLESLSR
ncbi:MAG: response regulator [Proteobacteria bacterium]|nr:response regulator [Pseudomonadota bacterium]